MFAFTHFMSVYSVYVCVYILEVFSTKLDHFLKVRLPDNLLRLLTFFFYFFCQISQSQIQIQIQLSLQLHGKIPIINLNIEVVKWISTHSLNLEIFRLNTINWFYWILVSFFVKLEWSEYFHGISC